ncbi:MAG: formate/nitrite transporter family protein [Muribaculaceae bacterium]|nr:formate/nitrite transporter family protein [Muribaculaceae bacterium]
MTVKSPTDTIKTALEIGASKASVTSTNSGRLITLSILAGAYIALGGVLSLIIGYGFPGISATNPGMQKLLSGCVFPVGLILVVVLGAELFTGNNALLVPAFMAKRCSMWVVLKNWTIVYLGNFLGAIVLTRILVYDCGLTAAEPYHSSIIGIAQAKVSMPWLTVFLKGVGANWCVCLGVWLALSGHNLVEKMLGCWFPVMTFVALGFEHSIANMFFIPLGMMEGADVTAWQAIANNLIPATLGNIVGGALLVGAVHTRLHLK